MFTYKAPLRDFQFIYHELFSPLDISSMEKYTNTSEDLVDSIWEEGAKLCENKLFPINQSGDEEGCDFNDGNVMTPTGFQSAYKSYVEGGWAGLSLSLIHI